MSSEISAVRDSGKRVSSIARSIGWSYWWRRLLNWLFFDALVIAAIYSCWHVSTGLPIPFIDKETAVRIAIESAAARASFSTFIEPFLPVAGFVALWEVVDLLGIFSDIRRVRRKLQPLQDLALAAEAIGQAAVVDPMAAGTDKMATLEQAIARASVDSPTVSTGDQDLRSIEVALNGLLRQMQEAKLQQMRFVNDASHELRTPIAVIQGYVNMLDRWGKTDESVLEESIEALKAESDHMQELVEQLLFLARGDSGRNALNRTDVNIAQVVHEVWEESCMIDEQHDYRCTVSEDDTQSDRLLTEGDLAMLKQSLRIIVQNAEKYSPTGSTITLSARREGQSVCYSVQDEGIGMSEADVRHIFERFYRAEGARDGEAAGTGLGLSIAKWIVDAHEGSIEVVSREGVGTRFIVRLPAKQV